MLSFLKAEDTWLKGGSVLRLLENADARLLMTFDADQD